ncbi:hypothetical protein FSP39_020460 [Pinctada imbricata]|uniref:Uncharacterized protein n=1 Tax=Pinctada imbricata TaxID=66713 RepID=A0AA88YK11_PINIB|nr:hypothetical protein FSP39_020460 [Pinctada imbricata]
MGFSESHILSKVALACLPIGCLFVIIGTATDNWYSYTLDSLGVSQSYSSGLWKVCFESICASIDEGVAGLRVTVPAYMQATRVFAILSILLAAGGTTVMVLAIIRNEYKPLQIFAIVAPACAALCAFIAVAVYGGEYESNIPAVAKQLIKLSWSFALTVVGGFIDAFSAVLFSVSFFKS